MPGDERVVEISSPGVFLRTSDERLRIEKDGHVVGDVPLVDVATIILTSPDAVVSRATLDAVTRHGGSVVVCGPQHQPTAMLMPLAGHHAPTPRLLAQAAASKPTHKRLWKQIVVAKIKAQAAHLEARDRPDATLRTIAGGVRSGDVANAEGWAAQRYWPALFGKAFRRRRDGQPPNALLNYGYAVLRAGAARALAAAGLHPTLGVNHHARNNPLCLADDLMEPFRPVVDVLAHQCVAHRQAEPTTESRAAVAAVLSHRVAHQGELRSTSDWLHRAAASLASVYTRGRRDLLLPEGLADAATYR
ncbi:MAG: type II CRISPR-associated endonuclease Cas1 [Planctomycetota bacterium]